MRQTSILILLFMMSIQNKMMGQGQNVSNDDISTFFNEIKMASKKNVGLWDKEVYGPMLLVEPKTRKVFANEPNGTGLLNLGEGMYSGILPDEINIANTAMDWDGKRWAMVMLPLSQNKEDRVGLLAHESFHRIQPSLGFELNNTESNHLDQKDGRIYLRLELEALKKALQSTSEKEQQGYLAHALVFRKYRHSLYEGSGSKENSLELNEGIAEFTGVMMSGRSKVQATAFLTNGINGFFNNATFVRSFAYHTTPIYGYLLYDKDKRWNKKITSKTDLTDYFIKAFNVDIPSDVKKVVNEISNLYNGAIIRKEETKREEKIKKRIAEYRTKFIDKSHLEIRFEKMNVSFNPKDIIPIQDKGTVYPSIRVTDVWGILVVDNGALMSPNWDRISISNPIKTEGKKISGDGWVLELKDGYIVKKDEASGNYRLIKVGG